MLPGISTEQLRSRLNRMVADGLLTRQRYREVPPRVDYELTERSRELMPVLGALARWGYDWTWGSPRPGEDVNVGAIFRLAPGHAHRRRTALGGTVELVVDARGELPERRYQLTLAGGRVEITEQAEAESRAGRPRQRPGVGVGAARSAPRARTGDLQFSGRRPLADAVLDGFAQRRRAPRRRRGLSRQPRYFARRRSPRRRDE